MPISRSNMSAYDKAITAYFICMLNNDNRKRPLIKKVSSAKSFEKILNILASDLKKHHPYGTPEDNWTRLLREVNQCWGQIKSAENDRQAIAAFIGLYNQSLKRGYYMWIVNEVKTQLANVGNSLKMSDADDQLLKAFVFAKKDPIMQSSGLFKMPELTEPKRMTIQPKPSAPPLDDDELKAIYLASVVPPSPHRAASLFAVQSNSPTAPQQQLSNSHKFN